MDKLPLESRWLKATLLFWSCLLVLSMVCPAWADDAANLTTLAQLEQKLFFQTYNQEDMGARLDRVEKRVFGQSLTGSTEERLARLSLAGQGQEDPDGTSSVGLALASVPAASPAVQPASVNGPSVVGAPVSSSSGTEAGAFSNKAAAAERLRLAVKAAKEEEINHCLSEGVEFWRDKQGAEALDRFQQVVRLDPGNAEALFSMGIIQEACGQLTQALASYQQALKSKPGNKDYSDAIAAVQKKLAAAPPVGDSQPPEIKALQAAAVSAYKRNDLEDALALYKQLDEKTPNQALVKYNIGTVYLMMRVPQKALEYYRQAKALNPDEPRFIEACNKLEPVIKASNSEVPDDKPKQAKQSKKDRSPKDRPSGSSGKSLTIPPDQSTLASGYGIIAKSESHGVAITAINLSSKAAKAGLRVGDIIRAIDGTVVDKPGEANQLLSRKGPSDAAQLVIQRDAKLAQVVL